MSYKNTMKLFTSNFTLVWKQLLYLICCVLLFSLCTSTVTTPIIELLKENGVTEDFKILFKTFYNTPSEFALRVSDMIKHIVNPILSNFSEIWLSLIGTIVLCVLLPYVLFQMSTYNITSILYQKFTMNMNVNYIHNGVSTLKQSFKFAFANILFNMPFFALTLVIIEVYLLISKTIITSLVGLMGMSLLLILLTSVKTSIFTYYTAYMVEHNADPFVSFGKGLFHVFKNFWKIMAISIILILTIMVANGFIAMFTFFAGLLISIPATFVLFSIYYLVTYFNIKGTRYYLSDTIIYNPTRYEVKKDDYVSISVPEVVKEINVTTTVIKKKYKRTKTNDSKPKQKTVKTKSKNNKG